MADTSRYWHTGAALFGFMAIAMGAVGEHGTSSAYAAELIGKASYYQLMHAILLWGLSARRGRMMAIARWLMLAGIVMFCGSLYARALLSLDEATLAPFGGSCLMLGWLAMAAGAWRGRDNG